jgi:hypothetical protein
MMIDIQTLLVATTLGIEVPRDESEVAEDYLVRNISLSWSTDPNLKP